ncbi:hypothetical protein B4U80_13793 [Leptotrombidium deliense]|uniref:Uncharacterized protein n=1 Tax=Leptotrombidium deliense TaxID=299467 RepID=A0A443SDX1_9ACAR|nr:hypothetical protein B4U80_13793 [Leptotrombidium deliense]
MLHKIKIDCFASDIRIKNLVIDGKKLEMNICPYKLKLIFGKNLYYEPELFPAIRIFQQECHSCLTIFQNGKWFITGVTSIKQAHNIINEFKQRAVNCYTCV